MYCCCCRPLSCSPLDTIWLDFMRECFLSNTLQRPIACILLFFCCCLLLLQVESAWDKLALRPSDKTQSRTELNRTELQNLKTCCSTDQHRWAVFMLLLMWVENIEIWFGSYGRFIQVDRVFRFFSHFFRDLIYGFRCLACAWRHINLSINTSK